MAPEVNYFDPVLENEIKDNANVIRLSEMDNGHQHHLLCIHN